MTEQELIKVSKDEKVIENLKDINRWDMLPMLFRMKGKPFSLENREQFSVMFSKEMVRETIVMSGRSRSRNAKARILAKVTALLAGGGIGGIGGGAIGSILGKKD